MKSSGRSAFRVDEVEEVGDCFERVVDLVRDGAGEAADGGELFALDERGLGLLLLGDLKRGGGDAGHVAVDVVDGEVVDIPDAVDAGLGGELAFDDVVADGLAGGDLTEELADGGDAGGDVEHGTADDLVLGKTDHPGELVVDAEVAEVDGVEESEADGGGLVDGLEFGALTFGLELFLMERLSEGAAVVNINGDAEPVEDGAVVIADGGGAQMEPAGGAVARREGGGPRCRSLRR